MATSKKLSDVFDIDTRDDLEKLFRETEASKDFSPIPAGEYVLRIVGGEAFYSRSNKPGYKLTLEVADGKYKGRRLWHDLWFTPAGMPMAKRDLAKLQVIDIGQLDRPFPPGILISAKVSLRRGDDGTEFNKLTSFDFLRVEKPDPFAPAPDADDGDGVANNPFSPDSAGGDKNKEDDNEIAF